MFIPDDPIPDAPDPPKSDNPDPGNAIRDAQKWCKHLGYRDPDDRNRECPKCGEPGFDGVWVDVGVGEQQVQPARCSNCHHIEGESGGDDEEFDPDEELGVPPSDLENIPYDEKPKPGWRPADK